jgi:membrane protein implicated in regulation of membrane protease activity
MPTPRMMVVLFAATGIVVAAVVALTLGSWWALLAVLFVHAVATTAVVAYTFLRVSESGGKPDPVTEARLEEERSEEERRRPAAGRGRDREVFE